MSDYLKNLERAFLAMMAKGWAGDCEKTLIVDLPGMKTIRSTWGSFTTVDAYYDSHTDGLSSGITTIFDGDKPVWVMHYGGRYSKDAIPFLKSCLHRAYETDAFFYGGRGPWFVREERFTYVNHVVRRSFHDFEGKEEVFDLDERLVGYHWYHGMALV